MRRICRDHVHRGVSIDLAPLREQALRARRMGFGAKLCIHPKQLDSVNTSFSPSEAELDWARRVLDAAAVAALDGKMIDRPVIAQAQRLIDLARRRRWRAINPAA